MTTRMCSRMYDAKNLLILRMTFNPHLLQYKCVWYDGLRNFKCSSNYTTNSLASQAWPTPYQKTLEKGSLVISLVPLECSCGHKTMMAMAALIEQDVNKPHSISSTQSSVHQDSWWYHSGIGWSPDLHFLGKGSATPDYSLVWGSPQLAWKLTFHLLYGWWNEKKML